MGMDFETGNNLSLSGKYSETVKNGFGSVTF